MAGPGPTPTEKTPEAAPKGADSKPSTGAEGGSALKQNLASAGKTNSSVDEQAKAVAVGGPVDRARKPDSAGEGLDFLEAQVKTVELNVPQVVSDLRSLRREGDASQWPKAILTAQMSTRALGKLVDAYLASYGRVYKQARKDNAVPAGLDAIYARFQAAAKQFEAGSSLNGFPKLGLLDEMTLTQLGELANVQRLMGDLGGALSGLGDQFVVGGRDSASGLAQSIEYMKKKAEKAKAAAALREKAEAAPAGEKAEAADQPKKERAPIGFAAERREADNASRPDTDPNFIANTYTFQFVKLDAGSAIVVLHYKRGGRDAKTTLSKNCSLNVSVGDGTMSELVTALKTTAESKLTARGGHFDKAGFDSAFERLPKEVLGVRQGDGALGGRVGR